MTGTPIQVGPQGPAGVVTASGTAPLTLNYNSGTQSITGSIAANSFDAYGAAATVQTNLTSEVSRAMTAEGLAAQKSANLSDLASAPTARTNLGLGTAATTNSTAYDAAGAASTVATNAAATYLPLAGGTVTGTIVDNVTFTSSTAVTNGITLNGTDSTTGTGGYNGLAINITGSGTGTGNKYPFSVNVGGSNVSSISKAGLGSFLGGVNIGNGTTGTITIGDGLTITKALGSSLTISGGTAAQFFTATTTSTFSNLNLGYTLGTGTISTDAGNKNLVIAAQNWTSAGDMIDAATGTFTNSTGVGVGMAVKPTYTTTGTAAGTALLVNPTYTSNTGSGNFYIADFQNGGVSKVNVDTVGNLHAAYAISASIGFTGPLLNNGNSTLSVGGGVFGAADMVDVCNTGTFIQSTGNGNALVVKPTNSTTGTGSVSVITANLLGSGTGSGTNYLYRGQKLSTDVFNVDQTGAAMFAGTVQLASINTSTTPPTVKGQICVDSTTGKLAVAETATAWTLNAV